MQAWLKSVTDAISLKNDFVLMTVIDTKGSTPCINGDKIVVASDQSIFGSIGGGNLEFKALAFAADLLSLDKNNVHLEKFPLGASLGQCCGGYVKVMFESFLHSNSSINNNSWINVVSELLDQNEDFVVATIVNNNSEYEDNKLVYSVNNNNHLINEKGISSVVALSAKELLTKTGSPTVIQYTNNSNSVIEICLEKNTPTKVQSLAVFGAGHISRALMPILTDLPVNIYWIDDRVEQFNKYQGDTSKINIICEDFLNGLIDLPDDIYCLVITYSHQIDYEICEKIISKNKFSYLGMIGSAIKGKKFRDRFINKGYQQEVVDKFTCPIGEKQKFLKSPTSIAVTIAMDLINFIEDKRQSEII